MQRSPSTYKNLSWYLRMNLVWSQRSYLKMNLQLLEENIKHERKTNTFWETTFQHFVSMPVIIGLDVYCPSINHDMSPIMRNRYL